MSVEKKPTKKEIVNTVNSILRTGQSSFNAIDVADKICPGVSEESPQMKKIRRVLNKSVKISEELIPKPLGDKEQDSIAFSAFKAQLMSSGQLPPIVYDYKEKKYTAPRRAELIRIRNRLSESRANLLDSIVEANKTFSIGASAKLRRITSKLSTAPMTAELILENLTKQIPEKT